ncbi:putative ATPase [Dysgonomonas sp. PH5-45]|uniref:AAA family ATPase n=1 Tax=unclassified Dysgonomonas TaxID=2630389 RepID=UPI002474DF92|nr:MULTISPECIES: AAA family ATPase [unclassified Dysgonomonas]MDH6355533.1 putative ATPase [Dysgonomonas sp. PH5-45]MDH6388406.1 putative ATPase [Dysgonomonas sp. PH5-37]
MGNQGMEKDIQFRLIAVRPLKECARHIRKILKEDKLYFFYQDYQESENAIPEKRKNSQGIPKDFYTLRTNSNKININISAIVGKNGDGKSSLIELAMRILNNFACVTGYKSIHDDLHYVEDVYAELYYEIQENDKENNNKPKISLYLIKIKGRQIYWATMSSQEEKLGNWTYKEFESNETNLQELKKHEHLLFYTQVVNYSLYAYNVVDFAKEYIETSYCWLDGIFHKNDGYQTPIVLNPFRDRGIIDINKENNLAKARLAELFLNDCQHGEKIEENSYRKVDDKLYAKTINTKLKLHNKEQEYVYDFIGRTLYSDTSFGTVADIDGNTNSLLRKDEDYDVKKSLKFIESIVSQLDGLIGKRSPLNKTDRLNRWSDILKDYLSIERIQRHESEIEKILNSILRYIDVFLSILENTEKSNLETVEKIQNIAKKLKESSLSKLNFIQLQRLALVNYCETKWNYRLPKTNVHTEIDNYIRSYIIYKTISIIDKYPDYKEYTDIHKGQHHLNFLEEHDINQEIKDEFDKAFNLLLDDIKNDKTHVTLKLRRALVFLYMNPYRKDIDFINKHLNDPDKWNGMPSSIPLYDYYSNVKDLVGSELCLKKFAIKDINLQELLPPPIFNFDIGFELHQETIGTELKRNNQSSNILLSDLSSGQRQLLYFVSSVIYHLRNLNSVKSKKSNKVAIKYSHVNLIFEEVELYFHPEYQRILINYLLTSLNKVSLPDISSINICFSTHSPFILSDIPKQNVLMLQEGEMASMDINTFGANITDLLANTFFLNKRLIGEFAYNKIREIVEWLDEKNEDNKNNAIYYKNIIKLIDEPIAQRKLSEMYDKKMGEYLEVEMLEKQINYLNKLKENASHKFQSNQNKKS